MLRDSGRDENEDDVIAATNTNTREELDESRTSKAESASCQEDMLGEPSSGIDKEQDVVADKEMTTPDNNLPIFPPTLPAYFHPPLALPKIPKQEMPDRPDSVQSNVQEKGMSPSEEMMIPMLASPFRGLGSALMEEQALLDPRHIIQMLTRKVCNYNE